MLPFVAGGHLFINVENEAAGGERGQIKLDDSAKIKTEKKIFRRRVLFQSAQDSSSIKTTFLKPILGRRTAQGLLLNACHPD